jgi:hypothetical protein
MWPIKVKTRVKISIHKNHKANLRTVWNEVQKTVNTKTIDKIKHVTTNKRF